MSFDEPLLRLEDEQDVGIAYGAAGGIRHDTAYGSAFLDLQVEGGGLSGDDIGPKVAGTELATALTVDARPR